MMVAADKVLAITFPFKHRKMMILHEVTAVITGAWLLALIPTALVIILNVMAIIKLQSMVSTLQKELLFLKHQ